MLVSYTRSYNGPGGGLVFSLVVLRWAFIEYQNLKFVFKVMGLV